MVVATQYTKTKTKDEILPFIDRGSGVICGSASRRIVHREGLWHPVSCLIVVYEPKGIQDKRVLKENLKLLVVKRSDNVGFYPGKWSIPSEHQQYGENSRETARRCYEEEFYTKICQDDLDDLERSVFVEFKREEGSLRPPERQLQQFYLLFESRKAEDMKYQTEEISEIKFMPLEEILDSDPSEGVPLIMPAPSSTPGYERGLRVMLTSLIDAQR
ncbi:MAG: NUDIX hydrolase [Nanoarchaeota archaeon]|nr:NUDIX hydrolase [Nanoarchaeota archaeon]